MEKQKKAIAFLENAFIYNKEAGCLVFNDDKEQADLFKDACFNSGMEIKDFDYQVYNEAVEYIWSSYLHDVADNLSDDLPLEAVVSDIENIEFQDVEPDAYTSDLLKWLQDDIGNISYCDEAMAQLSPEAFTGILSGGQYLAKLEKMEQAKRAVIEYLENYIIK